MTSSTSSLTSLEGSRRSTSTISPIYSPTSLEGSRRSTSTIIPIYSHISLEGSRRSTSTISPIYSPTSLEGSRRSTSTISPIYSPTSLEGSRRSTSTISPIYCPTSLEGSRRRTSTISPIYSPTSQSQTVERVFSPDIPFSLKKLSRSPREILEKKATMVRSVGEVDEIMERVMVPGGGEEEMMVQLRLFYLGVINSMQNRMEVESEAPGVKILEDRSKTIKKELERIREKVGLVEKKKKELAEQFLMIRREIECLKLVRQMEEREYLDGLISFQKKMKNCLTEISRLQSSSPCTPETVPELSLYSKVFKSPSPLPLLPLPPTSGGLLQFSNLFCLSGQLVQFCQGQHGSKLVVDRLRKGTEPERKLAREELGLPRSLGIILETGNVYCREVVLTLVETDRRTRVEVVEQVKRNRREIFRIDGGEEFVEQVMEMAFKRSA